MELPGHYDYSTTVDSDGDLEIAVYNHFPEPDSPSPGADSDTDSELHWPQPARDNVHNQLTRRRDSAVNNQTQNQQDAVKEHNARLKKLVFKEVKRPGQGKIQALNTDFVPKTSAIYQFCYIPLQSSV